MVVCIEVVLVFVIWFFEIDLVYVQVNFFMCDWFKMLQQQLCSYFVYEYFNCDWYVEFFVEIYCCFLQVGLQFVCLVYYIDYFDMVNLILVQCQCLVEIDDLVLYQSMCDFMVNQIFCCDYWVCGGQVLDECQCVQVLVL